MKRLNAGISDFMRSSSVQGLSKKAVRVACVHAAWRRAVEAVYGDAAGLILAHTNAVYIMRDTNADEAPAAMAPGNGGPDIARSAGEARGGGSEADGLSGPPRAADRASVGAARASAGAEGGSARVSRETRRALETRCALPKQLIVYSDDSMVRSDLDARQEFLKMKLREAGEHVERFKILPSKMDMRTRHPFLDEEGNLKEGPSTTAPRDDGFEKLEVSADAFDALIGQVGEIENDRVKRSLDKAIRANLSRR